MTANATNIITQIKNQKKPLSFNHNCNHYSLSEGERQQKNKFSIKLFGNGGLRQLLKLLLGIVCQGGTLVERLSPNSKIMGSNHDRKMMGGEFELRSVHLIKR
jgi:hypothetical protein